MEALETKQLFDGSVGDTKSELSDERAFEIEGCLEVQKPAIEGDVVLHVQPEQADVRELQEIVESRVDGCFHRRGDRLAARAASGSPGRVCRDPGRSTRGGARSR